MEAGAGARPSGVRRIHQSRLRETGRELWRQGVPDRSRRRTPSDPSAGARRRDGLDHRLPGRLLRKLKANRQARGADAPAVAAERLFELLLSPKPTSVAGDSSGVMLATNLRHPLQQLPGPLSGYTRWRELQRRLLLEMVR